MNEIVNVQDFAVSRTTKGGKTSYRTALGVVTSGNANERAQLARVAVERMISNGNFRHLLREIERVFPVSVLKKASSVTIIDGAVWFRTECAVNGAKKIELEEYPGWIGGNKITAVKMAAAIKEISDVASAAGKPLKGEKSMYADLMTGLLTVEAIEVAEVAEVAEA